MRLEPLDVANNICSRFGVTFTPRLEKFIVEHTSGERVEAKDGGTHNFKRDSRAIPNSWRVNWLRKMNG